MPVRGIDVLTVPAGSLCIVNELAGEVWFADRVPQRQWLADAELDAWAATVTDHAAHRPPPEHRET